MASQGTAVGVGSALGIGRGIANAGAVGAAAGIGSAHGAGASIVRGVGAASGSGTAAAVGLAAGKGVGAASGAGTASGAGHAIVRGVGAASGAGSALAGGGPFFSTILVLSPTGMPPFSARGIQMRIKPIREAAQLAYDVNFNLVDISPPQARKFEVALSCNDLEAPAFSALWPGMRVSLHCSDELGGPLSGPGPERPIVPGSYRTEFSFYYYRPILTCLVAGPWEQSFDDEWKAERTWQLLLKEA